MKKILLLFFFTSIFSAVKAQIFCDTVVTYARGANPTNGVKIKTNLPFSNGVEMPTIILEGYNYGTSSPIGLIINFYVYDNIFQSVRASSFGAYTPRLYLANENGKVIIFIDSKDYFQRFAIRAFAKGLAMDVASSYQGWSLVDEAISASATQQTEITYYNKFGGTVSFPGNGIWTQSGRVGINNGSPRAPLDVVATATDTANGIKLAAVLGNAYNEWTTFGAPTGGRIRGSNEGYLVLETNSAGTDNKMYINTASKGNIIMATGGGSVGIGTVNPGACKLAVEGLLGARKIKVTQSSTWADYVFHDDYTVMPLYETEKFIKANKHLPGIPTAKEVAENGYDVGEMNRLLLEKVEEMTLHLIRMQKKIDELESKLQTKL
ncbi:hypothetical protein FHW36_101404 [Chitinophaga polysaccharea]|uniref:Endosialidase-like protein n=1 Tax=Chitinophaga polysaccharea TaxID=1293035 RepID=A0A561Q2B1_9BACT|nr:hypothetical protein [Chitinophaga polysaccharea]TWF44484.1 hypothetical protein FHW36_101404 [Chitinophaga polysaccharea]